MLVWSEVNAWEDSSNYVWTEGGTQERQAFKMQFLKCYIFSVEFCRDSVLGGSEK